MTCGNWKSHPRMTPMGFGNCNHESKWEYRSMSSTCNRHAPISDAEQEKRTGYFVARGLVQK